MVLTFTASFGMMVQMASSNTILQTIVEDDMRARVMSFYTLTVLGMIPVGSLLCSGLVVLLNRTLRTLAARGACSAYTVAIGGAISLLGRCCSWSGCRPPQGGPRPCTSGPACCRHFSPRSGKN